METAIKVSIGLLINNEKVNILVRSTFGSVTFGLLLPNE